MNAIIESMNAWGSRFAGFALPMLLQSAVLVALLFALDLALRKRVRATIRYALWMLALVKLALPPSLASPTGAAYWLPAETVGIYSAPAGNPEVTIVKTKLVAAVEGRGMTLLDKGLPRLTWQAVFFAVWLAVASGVGIWVVWRLRMVVGVIQKSAEAPEAAVALLESCRRQLGMKRFIPVRCAAIGSPAICGVLRPVILIPPGLAENLDGAEMRSVLLHELAHYKRGDLWVSHAQILLQIVYWYNPLVWLANASIRRAREQAVDEMVLVEMGGEAQAYPATLLHVAKLGLGRPLAAVGLMGILEPGRGLTKRILHIMNRPLPRTARIGARGLVAVLLLALVALPMACRNKTEPGPQPVAGESAQPGAGATKEELIVTISKEGALTLQNERVTLDDLQKKMAEAARRNPQTTLAIKADKAAAWENVFKVVKAARAAHINVASALSEEGPAPQTKAEAVPPSRADKAPIIPSALRTNGPAGDEVIETIELFDLPLTAAIRQLAMLAELNIQFDSALLNQQAADGTPLSPPSVRERWRRVSPNQALQALLDNYGWQMEQNPNTPIVRIRARDPNAAGPPWTRVNLLEEATTAGAALNEEVETLSFSDLPVPDVIRQLAALVGWNVQFDPRLTHPQDADHHPLPIPTLNETWKNLTPVQALQRTLDMNGWQMTQIPGNPILRVVAKDPKAPEATVKPAPLR